MGAVFVPTLQMKKLSPREVKELAPCCSAGRAEPGFELERAGSYVCTLNYDSMLPVGKSPGSSCWGPSVPGSEGLWEATRWDKFAPTAGRPWFVRKVGGSRPNSRLQKGGSARFCLLVLIHMPGATWPQ